MATLDAVYRYAPAPLQNLLISAYAWRRSRKRYGRQFDAIRLEVAQERSFDHQTRQRWLVERLRGILVHAGQQVPYYRRLFDTYRFRPGALRDVSELSMLPVLSKEVLRTDAALFRANDAAVFWTTETSGSTGTPLRVHLDAYAYRLSMALLAEYEETLGLSLDDRRATLAGRLIQPVTDARLPLWRFNWADHQMLLSSYHMSDALLPAYVAALERFNPAELIGYPSAICTLADFCRRAGIVPRLSLRAIVTNSETLFEWQRQVIEAHLHCRVYDYYGTAESVVFAAQCPEGRYHPSPLMGYTEVLADDGEPAQPGEAGRLVCTTMSNRAMPLVRYEIGDSVVVAEDACRCGRSGSNWSAVVGRQDDVVVTPEGRAVGRLDHVFKGVSGVRECQIAHTAVNRLEFRVVADDSADFQAVARVLHANARARVGESMEIVTVQVAQIPRTQRGKFKGVVREFEQS